MEEIIGLMGREDYVNKYRKAVCVKSLLRVLIRVPEPVLRLFPLQVADLWKSVT